MNTMFSKIAGIGILFLLVFVSGIWLTRSGKPYSTAVFTVHKLIALGALIFFGVMVSRLQQGSPLTSLQWLAVIVTALCAAAAIVTGGLVSVEKGIPGFILKMHKVFPYLTILSIGISLYLLLIRNNLLIHT